MQYYDRPRPYGAPSFDDSLKWLGTTTLITIQPTLGEVVSYGLASANGEPAFVEVDYLRPQESDLRLVSSIRNWRLNAPDGVSGAEFDSLVEHFMSKVYTLHPEAAPSGYREPKPSDAQDNEMRIDDTSFKSLRIDELHGLSACLAVTTDRVVTCVWDPAWSEDPTLTRSAE